MRLLTPEIQSSLPGLYTTERSPLPDRIAHAKLFAPWTNWTWYLLEYDPEDRLCFGYVIGHEREFGVFSLSELEALKGPGGLRIERDLHFRTRPLAQIADLILPKL